MSKLPNAEQASSTARFTPQFSLEDVDWHTCVHEAAHAIYAQLYGWPVRSIDADRALTVVGVPAVPLWPDHMQLAAYCLAGEYAAYRAAGKQYVFPVLEDLDCGLEEECEGCDKCVALVHIHSAATPDNLIATTAEGAYKEIQGMVEEAVDLLWKDITALARRLLTERRIVGGDL